MYGIVQVRGVVNVRRDIKDTLKMLRLHHINHCVIGPRYPGEPRDDPEGQGLCCLRRSRSGDGGNIAARPAEG